MFPIVLAWRICMKRRWKVGLALAVVGLAGFLVWAFLSDPNRGVAIRFLSYETNGFKDVAVFGGPHSNWITAHFCLTNGSRRTLVYESYDAGPVSWVATKTNGGWSDESIMIGVRMDGPLKTLLECAQSARFSVPVMDAGRPLRIRVMYRLRGDDDPSWWGTPFTPKRPGKTFFATLRSRVTRWFGREQDIDSVSITIQER